MKRNPVYRVDPRIKNPKRRRAIEEAYSALAFWAKELADRSGSPRPIIARSLAREARKVVTAFGVRT